MLVFEGILLVGTWLIWRTTSPGRLRFDGEFCLCRQCIFSFWLKKYFWRASCRLSGMGLFSSALTLTIISSACSPCWTNCFQVRLSATPIWTRSEVCRLWRHVSTRVAWVYCWDIGASYSEIFPQIFWLTPFRCFVARRVGIVISESSSKKRVRKSLSKSP